MAEANTLSSSGTLRPIGGWLRAARINGVLVLTDSVSFRQPNNFQWTKYALTPPQGNRQKTGHARGTTEPGFSISGEFTAEAGGLIAFLTPGMRGVPFPVVVSQGPTSLQMSPCLMETFNLTGAPNSTIKYSLSGKSINLPTSGGSVGQGSWQHPLPGWSSGNNLVRSWSITHSVGLGANFANDQNPFPAYYRSSESEYNLQVTTAVVLREYDTVSIGIGNFAIVVGLVTSRAVTFSGRDIVTWNCEVTNVNLQKNAYTPGATAGGGGSPDGWPV